MERLEPQGTWTSTEADCDDELAVQADGRRSVHLIEAPMPVNWA
jgi:hypothetical protein